MKVTVWRLALPMALLVLGLSAAGRAGDEDRAYSRGSVQAKIQFCKNCHGAGGQGYHGYLTMPRLAGQRTEYIEQQLQAFAERTRERGLFINMARTHGVNPSMRSALAAHFGSLNPAPFGGAPRTDVSLGRTIYEEGLPEANVPACSACHGPDAQGEGLIPRLAGQLYGYTVKELANWSRERRNESAAIMEPIARGLTKSQIAAVSAYLSYLK
jgi:cytochrome c553